MREINPFEMQGEHLVHKPRSVGYTCKIGYACDGHCRCHCKVKSMSFQEWFYRFLQTNPPMPPLKLYPFQEKMVEEIRKRHEEGKPIRLFIRKG